VSALSYGPESFAEEFSVSRETMARLERFAALLKHWQRAINLVSAASAAPLWRRHMLDSAQLLPMIPREARTLVDIGTGGGLPGLVLAILLADRPAFKAHLIESDRRKAAFLAVAAGETGAPIEVHAVRAELAPSLRADVVTARACAPLGKLLSYAARFWGPGTIGLFHKGRESAHELTQARESWTFEVKSVASRSDPSGTILQVRTLERAPRRRREP
jgi:16S rRNA (guanine527-N7)-methyltransferase